MMMLGKLRKQGFPRTLLRTTNARAQTKTFYNRLSRFYDFITERAEGPVRKHGLKLLGARLGEKILEIGIGTGHGVLALVKAVGPSGRVYGIDIADKMIEMSLARLSSHGLSDHAELISGDATAMPFTSEMMDGIFMSFTLELFDTPDILKVLDECRRILNPGGRIVVVGLSKQKGTNLAVRLYEWAHRHFPVFLDCRPIFIEKSLREAGFHIQKVELDNVAGIPIEIVLGMKKSSGLLWQLPTFP